MDRWMLDGWMDGWKDDSVALHSVRRPVAFSSVSSKYELWIFLGAGRSLRHVIRVLRLVWTGELIRTLTSAPFSGSRLQKGVGGVDN